MSCGTIVYLLQFLVEIDCMNCDVHIGVATICKQLLE